jgi:hypothetical protein
MEIIPNSNKTSNLPQYILFICTASIFMGACILPIYDLLKELEFVKLAEDMGLMSKKESPGIRGMIVLYFAVAALFAFAQYKVLKRSYINGMLLFIILSGLIWYFIIHSSYPNGFSFERLKGIWEYRPEQRMRMIYLPSFITLLMAVGGFLLILRLNNFTQNIIDEIAEDRGLNQEEDKNEEAVSKISTEENLD